MLEFEEDSLLWSEFFVCVLILQLDNDRRKIELAHSMLFTLPGSPILYYGDEIGMGDNIWLEDR